VLEGALRSRLEGGPEVIYRAGEGFAEPANTQHLVSANASHTNPVRFLALFLCEASDKPNEGQQR
jgi:quercetin dioxygenase-like cupin family protein